MPELHIVAGANGVGKTTAFTDIIPHGIDYLNADLIAKMIREKSAGRNVQDLANQETSKIFYDKVGKRESFAIETNLFDLETYKSFEGVQGLGYKISIYFFGVDDVNTCIDRVNQRVTQGGHYVSPEIVRQRYLNGLALLKHYKNFPDVLVLIDNSSVPSGQAILHKGEAQFLATDVKPWIRSVLDQKEVKDVSLKDKSIEEIRKLYKGKSTGL